MREPIHNITTLKQNNSAHSEASLLGAADFLGMSGSAAIIGAGIYLLSLTII